MITMKCKKLMLYLFTLWELKQSKKKCVIDYYYDTVEPPYNMACYHGISSIAGQFYPSYDII